VRARRFPARLPRTTIPAGPAHAGADVDDGRLGSAPKIRGNRLDAVRFLGLFDKPGRTRGIAAP
jgi:hypothetical protein